MESKAITPKLSLNKAFLKVKPLRAEIEKFKINLIKLLDNINNKETEEFHKNLVSDFLKNTYYSPAHFVNTKGRNDLVIHNSDSPASTVGVIVEAKSTTNKSEMIGLDKINSKALQELVLYYMRERITNNNIEVKHLIATNIHEWFVFDAVVFDRLFAQDKNFVKQFNDFERGILSDNRTDFFYKNIAEPKIDSVRGEIEFAYFDIRLYDAPLRNKDSQDDSKLVSLFKLLSPEHLLKLPFANDSNTLDKKFYAELLHIIGLTETKDGSKKLIERNKPGDSHPASLIENAIQQIDANDKLSRFDDPSSFGSTTEEMLFSLGIELCITWINRILFLKLLEAQLVAYHKGDQSFKFLNSEKIKDYDRLNGLFFQVLARRPEERHEDVRKAFPRVPYLNSSLFEPTEIEHQTIFISNLDNERPISIHPNSVLKDNSGRKIDGEMPPLQYLFEFLDAYDFAAEGSDEIQEDNKTLINASVLGLIFEKINGYKDGSFFTPGFITMYMCRETIRRAVVQKFNENLPYIQKNTSSFTPLSLNPSLHSGERDLNSPRNLHESAGREASVRTNTFTPLSPNPSLHSGERDLKDSPRHSWRGAGGEADDRYMADASHIAQESSFPTVITHVSPEILNYARELRHKQTPAEEFLWELIRNRNLGGLKFRRQHPLRPGIILDFYCVECHLAIELDGEPHNTPEVSERDKMRTYTLQDYGIKVIRFWNHEVINKTEYVLNTILYECNSFTPLSLNPHGHLHESVGREASVRTNTFTPLSLNPSLHSGERDLKDSHRHISDSSTHAINSSPRHSWRGAGGEASYPNTIEFKSIDDVYDAIGNGGIFTTAQANQIINSIKICDPAVGSGHFLVSALNEIIAIKSELRILTDRKGKRLKEYHIEVVNDELIVADEDGEIVEYNPKSPESQRVQETLFHEKQTIIENCLFGVDINPNSVKICRLRLWIELLKNAYYKNENELETLPNIDINIKCGNSLVSRFALSDQIMSVADRNKLDEYKLAVAAYKNAHDKNIRRELKKTIDRIKSEFQGAIQHKSANEKKLEELAQLLHKLNTEVGFAGYTPKEQKQKDKAEKEIEKYRKLVEEEAKSNIYRNAFEWRFEFPEVLDADGNYIGFDVVIGNPPYVQLQKDGGALAKQFENLGFETFERTGDIYSLFYENGSRMLKNCGLLSFITSNKWMRAGYGEKTRLFFANRTNPMLLIDFAGVKVFDSATVDTNILMFEKGQNKFQTLTCTVGSDYKLGIELSEYIENNSGKSKFADGNSWTIMNGIEASIKEKIERAGTPLKDWDVKIYRGILTGCNEAFIIDESLKNDYIKLDAQNTFVIKPLLKENMISKYCINFTGKYLINSHNGIKHLGIEPINLEKNYVTLFNHVNEIVRKIEVGDISRRGGHKGDNRGFFNRTDKGITPYNFRDCSYMDKFERPKIIWKQTSIEKTFTFDDQGYYLDVTSHFLSSMTDDVFSLKNILAVLNSKVCDFYLRSTSSKFGSSGTRWIPSFVEQMPIATTCLRSPILIELVDEILTLKQSDPTADTSAQEDEIDRLVYALYGLSEEEIKIVEGE